MMFSADTFPNPVMSWLRELTMEVEKLGGTK